MTKMQNAPVFLSKEEFVALLDDIRARVDVGDSFEGYLEYGMPWSEEVGDPETDPTVDGFRVRAGYRVGNRQGQGGFRMVGEMRKVDDA